MLALLGRHGAGEEAVIESVNEGDNCRAEWKTKKVPLLLIVFYSERILMNYFSKAKQSKWSVLTPNAAGICSIPL